MTFFDSMPFLRNSPMKGSPNVNEKLADKRIFVGVMKTKPIANAPQASADTCFDSYFLTKDWKPNFNLIPSPTTAIITLQQPHLNSYPLNLQIVRYLEINEWNTTLR